MCVWQKLRSVSVCVCVRGWVKAGVCVCVAEIKAGECACVAE